jgi:hypothetical protein
MTGERNCKIPKGCLFNSFPKALRIKLGDDTILKLCRRSDYRSRKHMEKCPDCGSTHLQFRSRTHDLICRNKQCKAVVPIIKKSPVGMNTSSINSIVMDHWMEDNYD